MSDERIESTGSLSGRGRRFGIVASRFNRACVEGLVAGALECLDTHGVEPDDVRVVWVPGAWEIPLALAALAERGDCDALIALGALVRGETAHFDVLAREASHGIARVSAEQHIPVGFGLLTCDTTRQALERAGGKAGNKGWEAALAALEMVDLIAQLATAERRPRAARPKS